MSKVRCGRRLRHRRQGEIRIPVPRDAAQHHQRREQTLWIGFWGGGGWGPDCTAPGHKLVNFQWPERENPTARIKGGSVAHSVSSRSNVMALIRPPFPTDPADMPRWMMLLLQRNREGRANSWISGRAWTKAGGNLMNRASVSSLPSPPLPFPPLLPCGATARGPTPVHLVVQCSRGGSTFLFGGVIPHPGLKAAGVGDLD
jgi:hypothetical protein